MTNIIVLLLLFLSSNAFGASLLDGINDRLSLANRSTIGTTGAFTIFFRSKIVRWNTNATNPSGRFISKASSVGNRGWGVSLDNPGGFVALQVAQDDSTIVGMDNCKAPLEYGKTRTYIAQYVPSTSMSIWIDGVICGSTTVGVPADQNNPDVPAYIGNRDGGCSDCFLDGTMSDVAMWNRQLTSYELNQLMTSKMKYVPLTIPGVVFYLPLDGHYRDLSGNNHHATPENGPTFTREETAGYPE